MIIEHSLRGVIAVETSDDGGATWVNHSADWINIAITRGVGTDSTSLIADVGTCTLQMLDPRKDPWATPIYFPNQLVRVRPVWSSTDFLFTGTVDDIDKEEVEGDDDDFDIVITVSATDDVQKHANTTLKQAVSQFSDRIEAGVERWDVRFQRLIAQADPATRFSVPDRQTTTYYSLGDVNSDSSLPSDGD